MLTYTKSSVLQRASPPDCPRELAVKVQATDAAVQKEADDYRAQVEERAAAVAEREALAAQLTEMWAAGPEGDGSPDGRWVSAKWLERALSEVKSQVGPIDNSGLACAHGAADPAKVDAMKLISADVWALLHGKFGGGPELPQAGCATCCAALQAGEALEAALSMPVEADGGGTVAFVDKNAAKKWRRWLVDGVSDANGEVCCGVEGHSGLRPQKEKQLQPVSDACWKRVLATFPNSRRVSDAFSVCAECSVERQQRLADSKQSRASRDEQRANLTLLRLQANDSELPQPESLPLRLHLVDAVWLRSWRDALDSPKAQPPGPLC
eukprot:2875562-Prymnesium_polylepis.1